MLSITAVISFLASPLGRAVGAGMILVSAYLVGDIRGRRIESVKYEQAAAAARAAAKEQDRVIAAQAETQANATIEELKGQKEKSDAQVAELQAQLTTRPVGAPCLYGPNGQPAGGVRNDVRAKPVVKKPARAAVLPAAPK